MGWNFVPEIVSICILTIILIFHHKTIYVRTRRDALLVRCIWTAIVASFINTLSVIAILNARILPLILNIIINDLFFLVTPFILVTFAQYWLYIIYEDSPRAAYYRFARVYMYVFAGIIAVMTFANHFTPLLYSFDENMDYIRGTAEMVPVYLVLSCIAVGTIALVLERNNVQKSIRTTLIATPAVILAFILLQLLMPGVQLLGTTLTMGVLLLYLSFHSNNIAYDKLTDCFNKDSFYLALRRNYPYLPPHAFIMVTVSNYSIIRDEYGQQMIDELVRSVSTYLRQVYGQPHTYRIGEDTFVCALTEHVGIRSMEEAYSHLNADWLVESVLCRVDCVIAFYEIPANQVYSPEILSYLKYAISKSTSAGNRGIIPCGVDLISEYEAEKRIAAQLKEAISSGAFSLYFEPICKIGGDQLSIIGADCGIGFQFAEGDAYTHEQVFTVAERYNLLSPINELLLQRACTFQHRLKVLGHSDILLFCEITQTQLRSESILTRVRNIIESANADPTRIKLQLGGQPVSISLRVRENLELLHRSGIGVCLKDTGRSDLDDLLTTPFAFVKLDEAALFAMGLSSRLNAFFRLVLSFFSQFGTTVIARNVVSSEHVFYLESHDIEYVQGPGVLPPMLDKEFLSCLDAQRRRY